MSHTLTRRSLKLGWALGLGLAASSVLQATAADTPPMRDQWYLDPPTASAPAISAQFIDRWYLDDAAPSSIQARSHRSQEEDVHIG